ncbi:MAG: serine O-acetyltransferase EpsC [Sumerlaeia bacterium]
MSGTRKRSLLETIRMDFQQALANDPAARGPLAPLEVILTYPGFHAIFFHRITHTLYRLGIPFLPRVLSILNRFLTGVEIHQAARIGAGFFIDHGMGVVIGETAIVGEYCTLFHQVTLGGTGKQRGKRHPTLGNHVVVGGGAKVLGNITLGDYVYVGANSVVLTDVPEDCTVVGIPGKIVKAAGKRLRPCDALDHIHLPDPVRDRILSLEEQIRTLCERLDELESKKALEPEREEAGTAAAS